MKTTTGYSTAQILLHWGVALGVVFNYVVSEGMGRALNQSLKGEAVSVTIAPWHVWVGMAVLVLAVLRIVLRLTTGGPPAEPGVLGKVAAATHGLLYVLILLVPALGALAWFGAIDAVAEPHAVLANLMLILALLHALGGFYHHLVLKDGILRRMLRPARA
jgi:cytochrome b561